MLLHKKQQHDWTIGKLAANSGGNPGINFPGSNFPDTESL